jgi:phosphoribosylanthranilate isomerase
MLDKIQIKVCGITDINQAVTLEVMGVDYIGFIFYALSKRYVLNRVSFNDLQKFSPAHAKKVGVFVNEPIENLINIVVSAGIDIVQLHGDEEVEYFRELKEKLVESNMNHVKLIKVFRVGDKMPEIASFENWADYYLFDTDSKMYGGTGAHFNWELLKGNAINKPFFLSGGIGPNDISGIEVMKKTKAGNDLKVLDINSQFETTPGNKNLEKIKTFIDALI